MSSLSGSLLRSNDAVLIKFAAAHISLLSSRGKGANLGPGEQTGVARAGPQLGAVLLRRRWSKDGASPRGHDPHSECLGCCGEPVQQRTLGLEVDAGFGKLGPIRCAAHFKTPVWAAWCDSCKLRAQLAHAAG